MPEIEVNYDPFAGKEVEVEGDPFAEASAPVQFAGGVNERLAPFVEPVERVLDFPRQIGQGLVPSYTQARTPLTDWMRSVPQPQTATQRVMRRAGEVTGENLPLAAIATAGAPAVAAVKKATEPGFLSALKNSAITMAEGIKNSPATAAAGELVSTIGAGFGGGTAKEFFGGEAEPYGQLVGGVAPSALAYTPVSLAARGFTWARSRFSPQAQTQAAKEAVSRVVGPGMTIEARDKLRAGEKLRSEIPGYEPSLAETTNAPSLVAIQRAMEQSASGPQLESMNARRASNVQAVEQYKTSQSPSGFNPEYVVDTATRRIRDLTGKIDASQSANQYGADRIPSMLPSPRRDTGAEGAAIREKYTALRSETRGEMSALADELKLNDIDMTAPFQQYKKDLDVDISSRSRLAPPEGVPSTAKRLLEESGNEPTSFSDIMALRSTLESEKRDALSGTVPNADRARQLSLMVGKLDKWLDTTLRASSPETKAAYDTFRQRYKDEYIDRFNQGAAFKVRARGGQGYYQTPDEKVAELFAKDVSSARQFKRTFGENAPERSSVQNVILDDLRNSAVLDGQINPRALIRWREHNADILKEFPEVDAQTRNIEDATRNIAARNASLESRRTAVEDSLLNRYLQPYTKGTTTADSVVDSALKNEKVMNQLLGRVRGDDEAMNALRRTVWGKISNGSPSDIRAALETPSVKRIMTSQHRKALENIADATEQIARVPATGGRAYDPNILADVEKNLGSGINQIMSRVFAAESGRTSYRMVALDLMGRFMRGRNRVELGQLLEKAIYDPEVAKDLADYIKFPGTREASAKRLNTWLLTVGAEPEDEAPRVPVRDATYP